MAATVAEYRQQIKGMLDALQEMHEQVKSLDDSYILAEDSTIDSTDDAEADDFWQAAGVVEYALSALLRDEYVQRVLSE